MSRAVPFTPRTIEIYERSTGEVVDTHRVETDQEMRDFRTYFHLQCNVKEFGYRVQPAEVDA